MSSTNRGGGRSKFDYYVTPVPAIQLFLSECSKDFAFPKSGILDPCAGGDEFNPMSYPTALQPLRTHTIDIRDDSGAERKADYLEMSHEDVYDFCGGVLPKAIISNPPFHLALEFIKKALEDVADHGVVVMLCRLNFFGSLKRKAFWQANMPYWAYVHSERMSFTKDGGTDSIEYAHLVWIKGISTKVTRLRVI